jgi:hypothetical protein
MSYEDEVRDLKAEFAKRYPHATIKVTSRTIKGKKFVYIKTVGMYKVESGRTIECFFEDIERVYEDYSTLTYKYKGEV